MKHFPIFLNVEGRRIIVAGGGDAAIAKLRLLLKTEGRITVFADDVAPEIEAWAEARRLTLHRRAFEPGDALCAALVYGAAEDDVEDARVAAIARSEGALVNIVDNLQDSAFITPAIVDRDPVVVAIGTEGAAPVLARKIKADLEERLSPVLGTLTRIGKAFRHAADVLPMGRKRRDFWAAYYDTEGPRAFAEGGKEALRPTLERLLDHHLNAAAREGHVAIVGAGPGDPELLTLKARRLLDEADVVIHDGLVTPEILELARREAILISVAKEGFGPSTPQEEINRLIVEHGLSGAQVVRLKGGDPGVFGRLDEEIEALEAAGVAWSLVPGLTSGAVAAAAVGQGLTKRGRNASVRILTGHDMQGFADHDWRGLAQSGEVAAIYMGKKSARFIQGRLLMHGALPETPVTVVENVSRPDQRVIPATLATLPQAVTEVPGPAILLYGLAPRAAAATVTELREAAQ